MLPYCEDPIHNEFIGKVCLCFWCSNPSSTCPRKTRIGGCGKECLGPLECCEYCDIPNLPSDMKKHYDDLKFQEEMKKSINQKE